MRKIIIFGLLLTLFASCFVGCCALGGSESVEENVTVTVGETATYDDIEFTLVSVEGYHSNGSLTAEPAEGKEFVILKIKAKNVGSEDDYINSLYEDAYCDDIAVDPVSILWGYDGETIWGDVAAGRTREGYIAYELPIGWETLEVTYQKTFSSSKITFIAHSNQITDLPKETSPIIETTSETVEDSVAPSPSTTGVGQTVTQENLCFTFVGIEKYVDTSDWVLDKPAEGKEFVILKFSVKNVGTESEYINMFYEDSYCDDVAIDPVSLLYNYEGDTIWGDVAVGKIREGYIAYELPIGWNKIEFIYTPSLIGNNKQVVFVGYSSDIN